MVDDAGCFLCGAGCRSGLRFVYVGQQHGFAGFAPVVSIFRSVEEAGSTCYPGD